MSVLLTILLWLLGIIGALLLVVLIMPLGLRVQGAVESWHAEGLVEARWAFGFLGVRVALHTGGEVRVLGLRVARFSLLGDAEKRAKRKEKKEAKKAEREEKRDKKEKEGRKRGLRWARDNAPLFRRLLGALHIRGWLRGTIGLDDPADTATLALVLDPVMSRLGPRDARLTWSYMDEVLELEATLRARVWPAELVWIFLATLVRGESRRALLATSWERRNQENLS